jgi:imidazole glycerol-phosphate synthase subunit HisH
MTICIIKYNAGNCASVANSLARIGCSTVVSDDPATIRSASHVIFPGVGEAASAMAHLQAAGLDDVIRQLTQPFLGICLGLQLLCIRSEERNTPCLGIFPNIVDRFTGSAGPSSSRPAVKVPHMGWNQVRGTCADFALVPQQSTDDYYYFLHSFRADVGPATTATCDHGAPFSAALSKDNFHAVQFHPEKSGAAGQRLLERFVAL